MQIITKFRQTNGFESKIKSIRDEYMLKICLRFERMNVFIDKT